MSKYIKNYRTKQLAIDDETVISPNVTWCKENSQVLIGHTTLRAPMDIIADGPERLKYAGGFIISFVMNGHGSQIKPIESSIIPKPLPVPKDPSLRFGGWYLDENLEAKAIPGTRIYQNTTLYAKWIENSLNFYISSATDTSRVDISNINSIELNGTVYSKADLLENHYNLETGLYTFTDFSDSTVSYIITTEEDSTYKTLEASQTFESLNGKRILLYPKVATLGDINVSLNWTPVDSDRIFDMYTLVYQGEAPEPGDEAKDTRLFHVSYSGHNTDIHIPRSSESEGGFTMNYDTDLEQKGTDWNPGETMKITLDPEINSLEELLRTYSFVFIANDYETGKPGTENPRSEFATKCPDMTWTIKIGDYIKTISLNIPSESSGESGDQSSNWIAFKTNILGQQEEIMPDLSNVITEFSQTGYSYFDGTNNAKTTTYNLECGGETI